MEIGKKFKTLFPSPIPCTNKRLCTNELLCGCGGWAGMELGYLKEKKILTDIIICIHLLWDTNEQF